MYEAQTPVAAQRRHATEARPDPLDDAAEALARQDAHRFNQRTREPAPAVAAWRGAAGTAAGRCCGKARGVELLWPT